MNKLYFSAFVLFAFCMISEAQVKSNYLYSTSMPYGTLDIRTRVSSTAYYYIQENKTFSFRESSPGVRTNKYLDMTSWDSSPYGQGNLRFKSGTSDKFVMNYRLLFPLKYSSTYSPGYPLIVMFHGAVERGNCYYNQCYHSGWDYDPNVNSPAAPKTATHKLLNNDHNLAQGGTTHLSARNLANGKLPNDPTVTGRQYPGFVLVPQMFNVWDVTSVQHAIRLVQLVAQKYNIDENRIYVHGLSIGGYAVYEAVKRAPWLFAAALPMSGSSDAGIATHNQQGRVAHLPMWIFQGGTDTAPSPTYTKKTVSYLQAAGAVVKYTEYAGVGHTCWHKAFAESTFFSWMLSKDKSNIHPYKGITTIVTSKAQYPKLMLPEGFHAYQWRKDGVLISGATTNIYTAKAAGTYTARFSRVANPTSAQWNKWSAGVKVTVSTSGRVDTEEMKVVVEDEVPFEITAYPNPVEADNLSIVVSSPDQEMPISVQVFDPIGRPVFAVSESPAVLSQGVQPGAQALRAAGMYIIVANQGTRTLRQKVIVKK